MSRRPSYNGYKIGSGPDAKKKPPLTDRGQWGRGLGKQGLPTDGTRHVPRKDNRSEALPS